MSQRWQCPFCKCYCYIRSDDRATVSESVHLSRDFGPVSCEMIFTVCPNFNCKELTVVTSIRKPDSPGRLGKTLFSKRLIPSSSAKSFPDYIPKQIKNDYEEACLIQNESPKASATLSRRCLEGIIRDFWKIKKRSLKLAIDELVNHVDHDTWEAIRAVKDIGNIGAHMEKDVNLIIEVEPEEAKLLVELIETLIEDWYIQRHERMQRNMKLKAIAEQKNAEKTNEAKANAERQPE